MLISFSFILLVTIVLYAGYHQFEKKNRCNYCGGYNWAHEDTCPYAKVFNKDDR